MKKAKFKFFLIDVIVISSAFLFTAWLKPATRRVVLPTYYKPFLIFLAVWIILSILSDKYSISIRKQLAEMVRPIIRGNFSILAFLTILIYAANLFAFSRLIFFGTILFGTALELFFVYLYFLHKKIVNNKDFSSVISSKAKYIEPVFIKQDNVSLKEVYCDDLEVKKSVYHDLKHKYLKNLPKLLGFLNKNIQLQKLKYVSSLILNTHTIFNIENLDPHSQSIFINLHKVNDVRRINQYFIQVNKNLKTGGFFIGNGETIEDHARKIFSSYPPVFSLFIYIIDFIYRRIAPKLPILKELYFALSGGMNRAISKAEILGRLYFCGFIVIATEEINDSFYFIAQKIKDPLSDKNPSYGPLIKLKRVGKKKEYIYIYKFRTMHPYSEYLQNYVHESSNLHFTGKFKDDFRITGWGKIFRRLWIDELPQLINLFRGEISLMGVRALSDHYFSLYPKDIQQMRCELKPGLVPPYYADMPNSFEEIIESERNYLLKKQNRKILTDTIYFCKAMYNIIFKHARSR